MRVQKKPLIVEAIQFTDAGSVYEMVMKWGEDFRASHGFIPDQIVVETLEGEMRGRPGDWVIRGVRGEFYICKADVFEASYDRMDP